MLIYIIYIAFISLGLPDGVFGVVMPAIQNEFGISLKMIGYAPLIVMLCSAMSSIFIGSFIQKYGVGKITMFSTFITAMALMGYGASKTFVLLLFIAIFLGIGQGGVDTGLNNYVAENYSSRHMSWLHCFWGIGASLGPFIMTQNIRMGNTWSNGYIIIGCLQILVAIILLVSQKLWKEQKVHKEPMTLDVVQEEMQEEKQGDISSKNVAFYKKSLLSIPALATISLFLVYSGAEFGIGIWANSMLIECRHVSKVSAGMWIAYYYAAIMVGRFLTGIVVNRLGNKNLIRMGMFISIIGSLLLFLPQTPQWIMMLGIIMIGLGLAPIYPCMIHETPKRFDQDTSRKLIGWQTGAACFGGAIVTVGSGTLFAYTGLETLTVMVMGILVYMLVVSEYLNRKSKKLI